MHWNYRVIKQKGLYALHEVYYEDGGDEKIGWGEEPADVSGCENVAGVQRHLDWMREALEKPVLSLQEDGSLVEEGVPS